MLRLTAAAKWTHEVRSVDLFLSLPHTDIDSSDDDLKKLAENLASKRVAGGSLVAPVWPPTGAGSPWATRPNEGVSDASEEGVQNRAQAARSESPAVRNRTHRFGGGRRDWPKTRRGIQEICGDVLGSLQDRRRFWRRLRRRRNLLGRDAQLAAQRRVVGARQPAEDLGIPGGHGAHHASLPWIQRSGRRAASGELDWSQSDKLAAAYRKMAGRAASLDHRLSRAQNDGTVKGSGAHDKTGRSLPAWRSQGKLDIVRDAGAWMRGDDGQSTRAFQHICWDGCMFPNAVMTDPKTWNDVLRVMVQVRDAHGWN